MADCRDNGEATTVEPEADTIVAKGFRASERVTMNLPGGVCLFGILVSTELDPRADFAVELDLEIMRDYLEARELMSPVADVHYYIYKQRYYHWWWGDQSSDEFDDAAGPANEGGDEQDSGYYGNDLVTEGDASLNSRGEAVVDFEVPKPEDKDEWDYSYRLEAQVTDASRREMQGSASFIVRSMNSPGPSRCDAISISQLVEKILSRPRAPD